MVKAVQYLSDLGAGVNPHAHARLVEERVECLCRLNGDEGLGQEVGELDDVRTSVRIQLPQALQDSRRVALRHVIPAAHVYL